MAKAKPSRSPAKEPRASAPRAAGRDRKQPVDLAEALVEAFLTNERIHQTLLDLLDPRVWNVFPACCRRRNIATSFAHIHNVRCMRLKMCRHARVPERLDRGEVTMAQARKALFESAAATADLVRSSLATGGHVPDFRPDVVALVCAAINHEAHHRGQICHWARELGAPIAPEQQLQLWDWDQRWREVATEPVPPRRAPAR